ncbi:hypothetical protein F442_09746 [Phytophthora nicotianae P10297]|uniref:Uncharacterized protein n=1 Tax=Phytophthora nicotianae P10297 TaxID=1317064 RepID=W2Z8D2_PHYNI|nr:hypothetical protein F442_09746 [Phytophthora nicotianae P10297]
MSLSMLSKLIAFLQDDTMFNKTMRLWLSAVCSLCFYGMCRINEILLMKKGDIQLGLQRKSRKDGTLIRFGCFTIRDRKTDHDPLASRTYSLHRLPKEEEAAHAVTFVNRWKAKTRTGKQLQRQVPSVSSRDKQKRAGRRDMVYITLLSERRGAIQIYVCSRKTEVVPETRQVVGCGSQSEKSETVVHYLLDDVMDREENQLGDSLAPDVVMPSTTVRESVLGMEYESTQYEEAGFDCYRALSSPRGSSDFSTSVVNDIKEAVLTGLRDMVKDINGNGLLAQVSVNEEGRNPGGTSTAIDTTHLVSELPDAKSWRDYVTQYWTSNPERHQYRAGVNMLPHERKIHRSRLSRMKIIAEFVQARLMGIWIALKPSLAV